jgi:catechol 2,3-dioxygenase-like lactoylglutathione lyase family enzyme
MPTRRSALAGLVAAPAFAAAQAPVGPWREALAIVADLEAAGRFWRDVAGWRAGPLRRLDPASAALLGAPHRRGESRLWTAPGGMGAGSVRLLAFDGAAGPVGRSNAMPWDTGGIFSIMTRTQDTPRDLDSALALGWTAFNDPYAFTFGPVALRNAVIRSPDQANVAVYERMEPRRSDVPDKGLSHAWNAMMSVRDVPAARTWFEGMGFAMIDAGRFVDPEPRLNNFAIPENLSAEVGRPYAIMAPAGADPGLGRIELMGFEGLRGRDLSGRAQAPNRGWALLAFPATDLAAVRARAERAGIAPVREGPLPLLDWVRGPTLVFRSPDGAEVAFAQA